MKVRLRRCPAIIGRKEAAKLLGMKPENLFRNLAGEQGEDVKPGYSVGLPPPLQDRGIDGFEVSTGSLWPRAEIEELARKRERAKLAATR